MSFITKRERVFNEYDLYELPARNEGKLKAYSSCTDARAWSHFCSDKSEHLVEIIKRNNDYCRPKYVPTEAIVNTLMSNKNKEIARLQRKIEEFEQMLAAYDDLELTCEQKCEIAEAHAAIKAANKELDGILFDLDLSAFTDAGDSDAFETGKSRGDEPSRHPDKDETPGSKGDEEWTFEREPPPEKDSKSNQAGLICPCDASTNANDPRIQEMQDTIVSKDAKLNAMQNTIAVMENDVCEPYCIYAHIYTALEKIFGILCQNDKYKLYLNLMTSGKDTRCIDIKGKILFKLKVLEKFSLALIAPCSQDFAAPSTQDCSCYRAEIVTRVETAYALTTAESMKPTLDNKRAQLVADIMENDEMKEILSKENASLKHELEVEDFGADNYNIDSENLKRLKNLQENYDDLMTCYEALKHEKDCLLIRCRKYEELEKEFEGLKDQLREYSALWNEKEHYRRRSTDLDTLKEQFMVLSEETSNLELNLKAESEINKVKTKTIDDLRRENLMLEQKLNEASMLFEKEKNYLQCKLKESDCKSMCQDQQIKSLSIQVDRLLEQDIEQVRSNDIEETSLAMKDEINSLKEQITNLKNVCLCNDEEKEQIQEKIKDQMIIINHANDLKAQVEEWKSAYQDLEKYTDDCRNEVERLMENNQLLTRDVDEKKTALDNLLSVIKHRSQDVNRLTEDIEKRNSENSELYKKIQSLQETYSRSFSALDNETIQAIKSLQLARQESQEVLEKLKDYDVNMLSKQDGLGTSFQSQNEPKIQNQNESLQMDSSDSKNSILHQEIQRLREVNQCAAASISNLQDEKNKYKVLNDLTHKESKILQEKLHKFEDLSDELQRLRDSHDKLLGEKRQLEEELDNKTLELKNALQSIQLKRQESIELVNKLHGSENLKTDLIQMNDSFMRISLENQVIQNELTSKKNDFDNILQSFNDLQSQNELKSQEVETLNHELATLKKAYDDLLAEKNIIQSEFDFKSQQINNLVNTLETKIDENKSLSRRLTNIKDNHESVSSNMRSLLEENISTKHNLAALRKESDERVKYCEALESEYNKLKQDCDQMRAAKENLERELSHQATDLRKIQRENHDLSSQSQDLLSHYDQMRSERDELEKELSHQAKDLRKIERENRDLSSQSQELLSHSDVLEKALINARTELIVKSSFPDNPHAEIIKEIEDMKKEKMDQQKKIRDLLDKLDESENVISNLSEDVSARDDKISILENHINQLEDEVRKLHNSLAEVVDTGEQITDNSSQKINQSLMSMEAHHSRATHNMKMEVAKLQSVNTMLEERLSATKMRNEETARDKHKYLSQISHLQNEREIIVTDIKQLEMRSVGDSVLSPERCDVEDILGSLDRIRRFLDARSSMSNSLEKTLLSVQNSYQLVQTKTDEAKKIVEKEKQKIVNEKEEAIKDKINMEKQLIDLKNQLEQQISQDKNVIKDLEAEILNQTLIIDKVNQSTQSYISKLEDDMKSLKHLYENALNKVTVLENQLKSVSEEKSKHLDVIERTSKNLEEKIKEVELLNKTLAELKKEPGKNMSMQTSTIPTSSNIENQATQIIFEESVKSHLKERYLEDLRESKDISPVQVNKPTYDRKSISSNKNKSLNEVQILTANVDPSFDYVKSSYLNYKLKQLSPGRLEQYSISCGSENLAIRNDGFSTPDEEEPPQVVTKSERNSKVDSNIQNFNVIDIYNKKSMHTNSSKANDDTENEVDANIETDQIKSPAKSSAFTGFGLTNESFITESNINDNYKNSNLFGSTSEVSTDKDLFVIYRDSESNDDKAYEKKGPWNANGKSEIVVEAVTIQQSKKDQKHIKKQRSQQGNIKYSKEKEIESDPFINAEDEEFEEDDSVKHKLKISLPRVENDSPSVEASDAEKRSLDSYTMAIYPSPKGFSSSNYNANSHVQFQGDKLSSSTHSITKDQHQYRETTSTLKDKTRNVNIAKESAKSDKMKYIEQKPLHLHNLKDKESHHKLSRVGADVLLIKSEEERMHNIDSNSPRQQKSRDFGLEYILDSHNDPNDIKTYIAAKAVRKTRSDERFDLTKLLERADLSPSRLSELKKSSTEYKTISSNSYSKSTDKSQPKSFNECSIMVKLDAVEEYESKIQHLTKTLENIEKDYKKKIDAIKMQYDNNIKSILNEHNQGVESIQSLHEETLQDILKLHENEVENLRTMSIEAMRKADKLEKENKSLKNKMLDSSSCLDEEPIKISTPELKRRKRSRVDTKLLSKTNVEAFNVKPKNKSYGPCTCSLDINISDTIRNIFEQVDVEQRKMAEYTYLKYIANKIMNGNVDALDTQELSFLHLKVCRIWKTKLNKEESLQKRIDSLEAELMNKQKHAQQNIAELDRKVAEERRRLQEVREAVCRNTPTVPDQACTLPVPPTAEKEFLGCCRTGASHDFSERKSAGDLAPVPSGLRQKRTRNESNRAVLAKLDYEERRDRDKKIYTDEQPTRLRKSYDRDRPQRPGKK